jgi:hypothetical protein
MMKPSGMEPATFRLVAQYLNQIIIIIIIITLNIFNIF